MANGVTLQDVASRAGVSKSTVSDVLRQRKGRFSVSEQTRKRIMQAVADLNYQPSATARALSTGKTYQIGYLLSSQTTMGLANAYFATVMAGVQDACQQLGYHLVTSTYDLSNIKNFVMPSKLQQRSVDGVVIDGMVQAQVIDVFLEQNVPFVMCGDNTDYPLQAILAVASDMAANWRLMLEHLTELGHRRIAVGSISSERASEHLNDGVKLFTANNAGVVLDVEVMPCSQDGDDQFQQAARAARLWCDSDPATRPTAFVGSDHWCVSFLSTLIEKGFRCPSDISVLCTNKSTLTDWYSPLLTTMDSGMFEVGRVAAELLINLIERKISRADAFRRVTELRKPGQLMVRASTGPAPKQTD